MAVWNKKAGVVQTMYRKEMPISMRVKATSLEIKAVDAEAEVD